MPEETSIWGRVDYLAPRLSSSTRISVTPFGEAISILFDDAQVNLDTDLAGLEGSWTTGLVLAVQPGERTSFNCQLRGFINKTAGSRALLTASVGGGFMTREFPYGVVLDEEIPSIDIPFDAAALTGGRVVVYLALYAERQDLEQRVSIVIDSVDNRFTIAPAGPAAPSAPASAP